MRNFTRTSLATVPMSDQAPSPMAKSRRLRTMPSKVAGLAVDLHREGQGRISLRPFDRDGGRRPVAVAAEALTPVETKLAVGKARTLEPPFSDHFVIGVRRPGIDAAEVDVDAALAAVGARRSKLSAALNLRKDRRPARPSASE